VSSSIGSGQAPGVPLGGSGVSQVDHVVIEDDQGRALTTLAAHPAGQALRVYAGGYDASGQRVGRVSVTWSGTGVAAGKLSPTTGVATTFSADKAGVGTIVANDGVHSPAETGEIRVVPGPLDHIVIVSAANGTGNRVSTRTRTAGSTLQVWAAGYDVHGNYIGDQVVEWSGSGAVARRFAPEKGTTTTFTAGQEGQGILYADDDLGHTDSTGTIKVEKGPLDRIRIVDAPRGLGSEVTARSLRSGEALTVWAAGYDQGDNYLDDCPVTWRGTGVADGQVVAGASPETATFTARAVGSGAVHADDGQQHRAATGRITVGPGGLDHISIMDAANGAGTIVRSRNLVAGQTLTVWAAGYDAQGNYICDVDAAWTGTGVAAGALRPTSGPNTGFAAGTVGIGWIHADDGAGHTDDTDDIRVTIGAVDHILIRTQPGGTGDELLSRSVTAGQTLPLWAAGYDAHHNYVDDIPVTWSGDGVVAGQLAPVHHTETTTLTARGKGSGRIHVDDGHHHPASGGPIQVEAEALHHVCILDRAGGVGVEIQGRSLAAGERLQVWAAGYDRHDNYIQDVAVSWTGTGSAAGYVNPPHGVSATLEARVPGEATIEARHGTIPQAETGVIAVVPNVLDHLMIRNAADGGGNVVVAHALSAGDSLQVWAAGYDAYGNFIQDVQVEWTGTGVVAGRLAPPSGVSATYTAEVAGYGTIRAEHEDGYWNETGVITSTTWQSQLLRDLGISALLSRTWVLISLCMIPAVMLLFWPPLYARLSESLGVIASVRVARIMILICVLVIVAFMLTLRSSLHRRDLTRQFKSKPGRSNALWALTLFAIAILLGFVLAFGWIAQGDIARQFSGLLYMVIKLFMTGVLFLIPVCMAVAAGFMAAHEYGKRLERERLLPLYADTERLTETVLEAARKESELAQVPAISSLKRLQNGGISLTLHQKGEMVEQEDKKFREDRSWVVEADSQGHLVKIQEQEPRVNKVEEEDLPTKPVQIKIVLESVRDMLGLSSLPVVSSLERSSDGEIVMAFHHDGKAYRVKADRWGRVSEIREQPAGP
jgi:hypothetical protein